MNAPKVPHYPNGISGGGNRATVSYAGPTRDEITRWLARNRAGHEEYLARVKAARAAGETWRVARYLSRAAFCRGQIKMLLGYQRWLDTMWAERSWYPYDEFEARRERLIAEGVIRA